MHIADLHCDLLMYLAEDETHTAFDLCSRAAIPQLREGGVNWQTLAIFTETEKGSEQKGLAQAEIFAKLPTLYPKDFRLGWQGRAEAVGLIAAIENASGFCSEEEPLSEGLARFDAIEKLVERILYVTLTWKKENRFGGGDETQVGLKEDGKELLRHLSGRGIAIDLSHTSDWLAHDLIDWIDSQGLEIQLIASHSNFRSVTGHLRNLTDELALEVIRRKGVIGLNVVQKFVGIGVPEKLMEHVEHGLSLGGENALCFGADFFYEAALNTNPPEPYFFPEYSDASMYPKFLAELSVSEQQKKKIAFENAFSLFML